MDKSRTVKAPTEEFDPTLDEATEALDAATEVYRLSNYIVQHR